MSEHFLQWPQFWYVTALYTLRNGFTATSISKVLKIHQAAAMTSVTTISTDLSEHQQTAGTASTTVLHTLYWPPWAECHRACTCADYWEAPQPGVPSEAAAHLRRCLPLATGCSDVTKFTAKQLSWQQECNRPYPATILFRSIGVWPELPEAIDNCLMVTQIGSNLSHAVGSQAGMTCPALPVPSILVSDKTENSPGALAACIKKVTSSLLEWNTPAFLWFRPVGFFIHLYAEAMFWGPVWTPFHLYVPYTLLLCFVMMLKSQLLTWSLSSTSWPQSQHTLHNHFVMNSVPPPLCWTGIILCTPGNTCGKLL